LSLFGSLLMLTAVLGSSLRVRVETSNIQHPFPSRLMSCCLLLQPPRLCPDSHLPAATSFTVYRPNEYHFIRNKPAVTVCRVSLSV